MHDRLMPTRAGSPYVNEDYYPYGASFFFPSPLHNGILFRDTPAVCIHA